jgi:hypothetical protein
VRVTIRGSSVRAELARTAEARARGLSGRGPLGEGEAMLFLFPEPEFPGFWMQGMRFDLDLVWIRGERVVDVTAFASHREPERVHRPREAADRVLEVPAGTAARHGWRPGDRVGFEPPPPPARP